MRPKQFALVLALTCPLAGCGVTQEDTQKAVEGLWAGGPRPDVLPVMTNAGVPFRYPNYLYAQKVQGNVTLRIFIDRNGLVQPDSTLVAEGSGYPGLDSAAVVQSEELRFEPAKLHGQPVDVLILFPVYFRHPDAAPLPGDTILRGAKRTAPTRATPTP